MCIYQDRGILDASCSSLISCTKIVCVDFTPAVLISELNVFKFIQFITI